MWRKYLDPPRAYSIVRDQGGSKMRRRILVILELVRQAVGRLLGTRIMVSGQAGAMLSHCSEPSLRLRTYLLTHNHSLFLPHNTRFTISGRVILAHHHAYASQSLELWARLLLLRVLPVGGVVLDVVALCILCLT